MWFPKRSDTNRHVQAQKQARSLKFWIYTCKVEELYYPCSENKGADQGWVTRIFSLVIHSEGFTKAARN